MDSIALPAMIHRETSLGILAGITNMTRLTRTTRRPILGKLVKMVKW